MLMPAPDDRIREFSDRQIEQFLEDDVLDGDALAIAEQFDRATSGSFFGKPPPGE